MPNTLVDAPIASDTLAFDQPLMEANNLYFANTLHSDHQIGPANGTRNDGIVGEGYHTIIKFVNQAIDPGAAPGSPGQFYTKTANLTPDKELFYRSASGVISQLTYSNGGTIATFGAQAVINANQTGGWTYLPGGNTPGTNRPLMINYGVVKMLATSQVVSFASTFPNGNAYLVFVTPRVSPVVAGVSWSTNNYLANQFTLNLAGFTSFANCNFNYWAVGF